MTDRLSQPLPFAIFVSEGDNAHRGNNELAANSSSSNHRLSPPAAVVASQPSPILKPALQNSSNGKLPVYQVDMRNSEESDDEEENSPEEEEGPSQSSVKRNHTQPAASKNKRRNLEQEAKENGEYLENGREDEESSGEEGDEEDEEGESEESSTVDVKTGNYEVYVKKPISSAQAAARMHQDWLKETESRMPQIRYLNREVGPNNEASVTMNIGMFWFAILGIAMFIVLVNVENINEHILFWLPLITSIITFLGFVIMLVGVFLYRDRYKNQTHEQYVFVFLYLVAAFLLYVFAYASLGFVLTEHSCSRTNPNERDMIFDLEDDDSHSSSSSHDDDNSSSDSSEEDHEEKHNRHKAKKCVKSLKNVENIVKLPIGKVRGYHVMAAAELTNALSQFVIAPIIILCFVIIAQSYHREPECSATEADFTTMVRYDVHRITVGGKQKTVYEKKSGKSVSRGSKTKDT